MRIAAALAWYDEPVDFLERMVAHLSGHVDVLVALDGPWKGMPGEAASPQEQHDALASACERASIELVTGVERTWATQVEKRAEVMDAAAHHGDWILVIDGDEWLACRGDLRERVARIKDETAAVVKVAQQNRPWPYSTLSPIAKTLPRLFRAGVTVTGPAHNDYTLDGEPLTFADLSHAVTIHHDNHARPAERRAAARAYRAHRRRHGTEAK